MQEPILSVAIMHLDSVDERRAYVRDIVAECQRGGITPTVVKDTQRNLWDTARRAWRSIAPGATHHLVLQDDVVIGRDFVRGVVLALRAVFNKPICLYANRKVVDDAVARGDAWVKIPDGVWGQGPLMPVALVDEFLRWERAHIRPDFKHDDTRWSMFLVKTKRPVWCTVPSLVQHALPAKSTIGHSLANRRARRFIGDVSCAQVEWSRGARDPITGPAAMSPTCWNFYKD